MNIHLFWAENDIKKASGPAEKAEVWTCLYVTNLQPFHSMP